MTIYRLTIHGNPQTKGSMKCVGARGRAKHALVEDDKTGARSRWRATAADAARLLHRRIGGPALDVPLVVGVVAFVAKPASNRQPHPATRSTGDVDKHARMTLDALDDGDVYKDDSRVVLLLSAKTWAEPGHERAVIFLAEASERVPVQILEAMLRTAPALTFTTGGQG